MAARARLSYGNLLSAARRTARQGIIYTTLVVFPGSLFSKNSSLYDPYWSVAPVPIALFWLLQPGTDGLANLRHLRAQYPAYAEYQLSADSRHRRHAAARCEC